MEGQENVYGVLWLHRNACYLQGHSDNTLEN